MTVADSHSNSCYQHLAKSCLRAFLHLPRAASQPSYSAAICLFIHWSFNNDYGVSVTFLSLQGLRKLLLPMLPESKTISVCSSTQKEQKATDHGHLSKPLATAAIWKLQKNIFIPGNNAMPNVITKKPSNWDQTALMPRKLLVELLRA